MRLGVFFLTRQSLVLILYLTWRTLKHMMPEQQQQPKKSWEGGVAAPAFIFWVGCATMVLAKMSQVAWVTRTQLREPKREASAFVMNKQHCCLACSCFVQIETKFKWGKKNNFNGCTVFGTALKKMRWWRRWSFSFSSQEEDFVAITLNHKSATPILKQQFLFDLE